MEGKLPALDLPKAGKESSSLRASQDLTQSMISELLFSCTSEAPTACDNATAATHQGSQNPSSMGAWERLGAGDTVVWETPRCVDVLQMPFEAQAGQACRCLVLVL